MRNGTINSGRTSITRLVWTSCRGRRNVLLGRGGGSGGGDTSGAGDKRLDGVGGGASSEGFCMIRI